jgi:outer membrane receptor protein involved in Fe transport
MLGRIAFTEDNGNFPDFRGKSVHTFFQDDWKVLPRLTLNLGMRYELSAPLVWTKDLMPIFLPGQQSKIFPTAPAGLLYKGDAGFVRGGRKFDKNNIAPRLGFSYDLFGNGKTAARTAFSTWRNTATAFGPPSHTLFRLRTP